MDPTHFLASRSITDKRCSQTVQTFYDTHASTPIHSLAKTVTQFWHRLRRHDRAAEQDRPFAVSHPAE